MGAVQIDIHKKERPYERIVLTEPEMVKELIENRDKLDPCFDLVIERSPYVAGVENDLNQELIALYSDIDRCIKFCEFSENQLRMIDMISRGWTMEEIAISLDITKQSVSEALEKMYARIVRANMDIWSMAAFTARNKKVKWQVCNGNCKRNLPLAEKYFRKRKNKDIFYKKCRECESKERLEKKAGEQQ